TDVTIKQDDTRTDDNLVYSNATDLPVGMKPAKMSPTARVGLLIFGVLAAVGWGAIAFARGETLNSVWLVLAAVGSYIIAFSFYEIGRASCRARVASTSGAASWKKKRR